MQGLTSCHVFGGKLENAENQNEASSSSNRTRQHHLGAPPAEPADAATLLQPLPQTEEARVGIDCPCQRVAPSLALLGAFCLHGLRNAGPTELQTAVDPIWVLPHIEHMQQWQTLRCCFVTSHILLPKSCRSLSWSGMQLFALYLTSKCSAMCCVQRHCEQQGSTGARLIPY